MTGIAFADTLARRGQYPSAPKIPFPPGYDIVAVVDKLGAGASLLKVGQRVGALLTKFGGYAEYVCAPENMLVPILDGLDAAEVEGVNGKYFNTNSKLVDWPAPVLDKAIRQQLWKMVEKLTRGTQEKK